MPLVSEMVHPGGFSFNEQRKIAINRDRGMTWEEVAAEAVTLRGETPLPRHCATIYRKFCRKVGRVRSNYHRCGRKPFKVDKKVDKFLISKLKTLRRHGPCTSTDLQIALAREMKVKVTARYIRKVIKKHGFKWLRRCQKRIYSSEAKKERLAFARRVVRLSEKEFKEQMDFSMDGVVLPMPPNEPTERMNFCRADEEFMWRKPEESFDPLLAGDDDYSKQVRLSRAVPMWGGCSPGGFAPVLFHKGKKVNKAEWAKAVRSGKLTRAIQSLKPAKPTGPWRILCDNEKFLTSATCSAAHKAQGIKLWQIPKHSPDLNPVERFWAWLRKKLRAMDLEDAMKKRPCLTKTAYIARVRAVLRSKKAQGVASRIAWSLKATCELVVKKRGAASGK